MSEFSKQYREKLLPGQKHAFADTDPEFVQIFESFVFDEVVNQGAWTTAPGLWPSWPPCWAARGWTSSR